jgi:hypothetical protein
MTSILKQTQEGLFIYRSEKSFPSLPIIRPNNDREYVEFLGGALKADIAAWFLSCEQSGNLWEVAKEDEEKFEAYCKHSLPLSTFAKAGFNSALEAGLSIPDTCYELRDTISCFTNADKYAYFKDDAPANETETDKEEILAAITYRIDAEYRKHKNAGLDWSRIAAQKIYSSFQITRKQ